MNKFLTSVLLLSLITISCKKEDTETPIATETTTAVESYSKDSIKATETTPSVEVQNPGVNMMMQSSPTSNGINPAHGQPGHRCEIPVGAPLNSAPKTVNSSQGFKNTAPVQTSAPQLGAVNPNGATQTAPGMNPPHGQEGHICSIAVGAPLPTK